MRDFRTYIICTTARSGSNLLCNYLLNDGDFGAPWELFNPKVIRNGHNGKRFAYDGPLHLGEYIEWLKANYSSPNGVFGVKVLHEEFVALSGFSTFQKFFAESVKIFLLRRSIIDQTVSYFFAQQTGQWLATDQAVIPAEDVHFNLEVLLEISDNLVWQTGKWRQLLNCYSPKPVELFMEDVIRAPTDTLGKIAGAIGIARPRTARATLSEQRNEKKTEFRRKLISGLLQKLQSESKAAPLEDIEIED